MLREALINLCLIACLFLSVGGLVYLGTAALVAREFGSKIGSNRNGSSGVEIRFMCAQGHSDLLSAS
jgi:hypothetical protein